MSLTAGTAFTVNTSSISDLVGLYVNLIGNIVYALTGYSPDLVGVAVITFLGASFTLILGGIGALIGMKWLRT